MHYAIIENGVVVNVAVADEPLADNWIASDGASIGWLWDGSTLFPPPAPVIPLAAAQAAGLLQIDADVDQLYARVIGNRAAEYEQAEREATVYTQVGYAGPVPGMVSAWAQAKGWTGQQAADDIVAQAAAWVK